MGQNSESAKKSWETRRKNGTDTWKQSPETIEKRRKALSVPQPWKEHVSLTFAKQAKTDTLYILRCEKDGLVFGKWGSTHRVDKFGRLSHLNCNYEVVWMKHVGENAPELEATIGRVLSEHPLSFDVRPNFSGKTETFEWNESSCEKVSAIMSLMN